ncbi:hypothetical protein RSAG8_13539, partial [Rhizoctonia solani AG-8 WAC10335]
MGHVLIKPKLDRTEVVSLDLSGCGGQITTSLAEDTLVDLSGELASGAFSVGGTDSAASRIVSRASIRARTFYWRVLTPEVGTSDALIVSRASIRARTFYWRVLTPEVGTSDARLRFKTGKALAALGSDD